MSLLMQALKKAEHAKQQQNDPVDAGHEAIALSPVEAPAMPPASSAATDYPTIIAPVETTRELKLSLEEALPPPSVREQPIPQPVPAAQEITLAEPTLAIMPTPVESPAPAARKSLASDNTPAPGNDVQAERKASAAQQKAKTVFASKQHPGNSRTALIAAAGGVVACAMLAGFGYYYWQTTSRSSSFIVTDTVRAETAPPSAAADSPDTPAAALAPVAPEITAAGEQLATPTAPAAQEAARTPQFAPQVSPQPAPQMVANPDTAVAQAPAAPKAAAPLVLAESQAIRIRQDSNANQIHPALTTGYQSFLAGDYTAAQQHYRKVLQQEPNNRDALLGMAAIAINRQQPAQAGSFYARLLELDPADPDAIAGMTSLQQGDTAQSESRLKKSLVQDPQAGAILFALGNLTAQQARWAEAQQYYFRAYGSAPGNADYAFNLAVSLDQLNQDKLALEYYQRALQLAQSSPVSFSKPAVQNRTRELQAILGN